MNIHEIIKNLDLHVITDAKGFYKPLFLRSAIPLIS